ncbi:hypothetical protein BG60_34105 [Caballeronia zhejiangensis]|uniref:Uncharacterized protein n=2 Tax=Caballeronia zhejiangensis TaxID=871203 RepID=A0A656QAD2_9BURK|nr:hypothetical protein BG60_34105 [Caballeronia zhejiangensis]
MLILAGTTFAVTWVWGLYVTSQMAAFDGDLGGLWTLGRVLQRTFYFSLFFCIALAGVMVIARPKFIVLYLRKFRRNTEIIDPSYQGGLGRRFRILTLYDGEFRETELPSMERWLAYIIPISAVVVALIIMSLATSSGWPRWLEVDDTPLGPMWQAAALCTSYFTWFLSVILILFLFHRHRLRRNKRITISSAASISTLAATVASMTMWWQRPTFLGLQSTIVQVDSTIWRETVGLLLSYCNVIVVDVTELTDALSWELSQLETTQTPFVLILESEGVSSDTASSASTNNAIRDTYVSRFGAVRYSRASKRSLEEFRQELRSALTSLQPKKIYSNINSERKLLGIVLLGLQCLMYLFSAALLALPVAIASYALQYSILAPQ